MRETVTFIDAGHKEGQTATLSWISYPSISLTLSTLMWKWWNLESSDICLEFLNISQSGQRSSSYFQTCHVSEIQALGMHPCCPCTSTSVQEGLDGDLGMCVRSATDDLPRRGWYQRLCTRLPRGFQTLQAALGQPVRLPAKAGVSQMVFW